MKVSIVPRTLTASLIASALLFVAVAAIAVGLSWQWRRETANLFAADARLREALQMADTTAGVPLPNMSVAQRPVTVRAFSQVLDHAARDANVAIVSVSSSDVPGSADRHARRGIDAVTRGAYPASKRAWAEVLDRLPDAVVVHVTLRRTGAGTDVESEWLLSLPTCTSSAPSNC